ncbi:HNH endonuclease [Psychrobacillus sp. INOP01]|uniref:T7SS effector LXG polymorphic toxin n=1 Tax=Psychrobacillus sp. INOP01 TaxID=2829187 RepID=UPI001BA6D474|nr:T7SS effector LXG polymorphic toxin [Psychrobacillus sp. INOP01]QUG40140.1 HNH endonuclease [Psychrobacillus sp. INOP01]
MKILDVDLFQDGLRRNIAMLDRLGSEVEAIHRAVEGLVAMEDKLKGEGGSALRAFYAECHLPLLQQFLVSAAGYKQVLQQMESALDTLEPDTTGHIVEQFLEGEVEQGLTTIAQLTENLTNESNSIMDQVSDIVALPHLDDSGVQEGVLDAKRKRDDTVSRLQEFDATQTAALLPFEQDMQAMDTWINNMEEMFASNLTDIHFQTDRWAELVACSRPLTISTPTIEGEMCLREEEEEKSVVDTGLEVVDGILSGLFDVGKDLVTGIVDIFQDPKATLEATVEAVTNPVETYNTIKSAITTSYERDMVNGDANSRAHWVTYALGTVATSVVGTKSVGALTKSGVKVTKAVVPKVAGAVNNASASLANLLPYGPRPQFAIAGEVPYNTVNATGLRDQVTSIVRAESGVKGTVKDRQIYYTRGFDVEPKYSSYEQRVKTTPVNKGEWSSERAESLFISDKTGEVKKYLDEAGVDGVDYKNGMPDFSPFSKGEIKLENMTNDRKSNFSTADEELAKKWSTPDKKWTAEDVADWREDNKYTWHELNDLETIQLVPSKINSVFKHLGGVGEYNIKVKIGE